MALEHKIVLFDGFEYQKVISDDKKLFEQSIENLHVGFPENFNFIL